MPASVFNPPLAQALRLEVEVPPAPGAPLLNLMRNHSGAMGGFQWVSPLTNSAVGRSDDAALTNFGAFPFALCYYGQPNINYADNPAGSNYFLTELRRVKPGSYVGTSFLGSWCINRYRATIIYYDAAKTFLGNAVASPIYAATTLGPQFYNDENPVPSNAFYAAIQFEIVTPGGAAYRRPSSDTRSECLGLVQVMMKNAPTKAAAQAVVFNADDVVWANVMGPTHEISFERKEADLGILKAEILDATLDPALNGTFRSGRRCRLITSTGEPLFTGKVRNVDVTYDLGRTDGRGTRIALEAVDPWADLAGASKPNTPLSGIGAVDMFEGTGVPWSVNGVDSHNFFGGSRAVISDAKSADQVHLYRDTDRVYVSVNRAGTAVVRTGGAPPIIGLLTEADYSSLDVGNGLPRVINYIRFRILTLNSSNQMIESFVGPYIDGPSLDDWGPRTAEFTLAGSWTYPQLKSYADAVFAANAQPSIAAQGARVPIRNNGDIIRRKALVDLDEQVGPINTARGLNVYRRVVGISQTISSQDGGRWFVDLEFDAVGARPVPTAAPDL